MVTEVNAVAEARWTDTHWFRFGFVATKECDIKIVQVRVVKGPQAGLGERKGEGFPYNAYAAGNALPFSACIHHDLQRAQRMVGPVGVWRPL